MLLNWNPLFFYKLAKNIIYNCIYNINLSNRRSQRTKRDKSFMYWPLFFASIVSLLTFPFFLNFCRVQLLLEISSPCGASIVKYYSTKFPFVFLAVVLYIFRTVSRRARRKSTFLSSTRSDGSPWIFLLLITLQKLLSSWSRAVFISDPFLSLESQFLFYFKVLLSIRYSLE